MSKGAGVGETRNARHASDRGGASGTSEARLTIASTPSDERRAGISSGASGGHDGKAHSGEPDDGKADDGRARGGEVHDGEALGEKGSALPDELRALAAALDSAERDARTLVAGLSDAHGAWRAEPGSWSVAECLDHLATANRVYLDAMTPPASHALARGQHRRRPALPGLFGGWFVRVLEPPVRSMTRVKAPRVIQPRPSPPLADAAARFLASQDEVRAFLRTYAAIDLAGVPFPNPFIRGLRFTLATGLHVIAAHERRHLWQAWRVRRQSESAASGA